MSKKIAFLRNFIQKHRVAIAIGMTATAFILLMMRNAKVLNAFLEEHNLLDAYYSLED